MRTGRRPRRATSVPLLVAHRRDPHAQGTARGPLRGVSQIGPVLPGQQGGQEERCVGVCVGPRPGRKTAPADHDGREEFGRLRLRAHMGLSSAAAVGIHDAGLSRNSLRRGGATFHFTQFASLDATTSYGRWQLSGTARKYISQAVADLEEVRLRASGSTRASRLARIFQPLVVYKLQQCSAEDNQDF